MTTKSKSSKNISRVVENNPIFEYYQKIESGEIITSLKVKRIYKHIIECLKKGDRFIYNKVRAQRAIEFIEKFCKHSKGKWGGQPIILELWQKAYICTLFGVVYKKTGERRFKETMLVVGRKNGKSIISSAIGNYMLIADGEQGAECYAVATKRDQAKIVWNESAKMIRKSPALKKVTKITTNNISFATTESDFKPLCSDDNTLDGLNPHFASLDEIHAWKDGYRLYDVIRDGTSAREEPIILAITTAGTVREDLYDGKYADAETLLKSLEDGSEDFFDENFFPVIYELDERSEWTSETAWIKANPNLGVSKSISYLKRAVNNAKLDPLKVANLLTKEFNIRETSQKAWLTYEAILNQERFNLKELAPTYYLGGADLSRTTDLTAANILFRLKDSPKLYCKHMYWIPEDLLDLRVREDKIPYDKWYSQGLIRLCRGNLIDPSDVTAWFAELMNEFNLYPFKIGYDRYSATYWVKEMTDTFGAVMYPVAQGKQTLSNPMRMLGVELTSKNIIYDDNPITKWCLSNIAVDVDKNDNIQPCKTSNPRMRIDGGASLLNSYVAYKDFEAEYKALIDE
ncbi:MAG: terminase large subunit [Candidatus Gastranaerophilales bacterium]|nr:terminase large subunit [Candidatus Gastranaerophilales bacterium]